MVIPRLHVFPPEFHAHHLLFIASDNNHFCHRYHRTPHNALDFTSDTENERCDSVQICHLTTGFRLGSRVRLP